MRLSRVFFIVVSTILAMSVWTGNVTAGALEGWWRQSLAPSGDTREAAHAPRPRHAPLRRNCMGE